MRNEFQKKRLRCRPWQRLACRRPRPRIQVREIGRHGAKGVGPKTLVDKVLEGRDILLGQEVCECIAPLKRQDSRDAIELVRARERFGISKSGKSCGGHVVES
jgi:hypothetical protein